MIKELLQVSSKSCVGCNRCVRECPMELANITYLDEAGDIKVRIDAAKCINCGRCISACKHGARFYNDDIARFIQDLGAGVPISLIAAPSIRTNLPDYKRLFTYLKNIGVKRIYDVSLGADICIWAHVRLIERTGSARLITQPCPAIVSFCERYRHDLLKYLSPVHSPMGCVSIYMQKHEGITDRIAALSPCVAKAEEFEKTGLTQYNVTFEGLRAYLEERQIALPQEESDFDHYESGLGSLFPMPGGLKENIEFYFDKKLHVSKAEGFDVYQKLNAYLDTPEEWLPEIFDVLNCVEGCNIGPACSHDRNFFEIDFEMQKSRKRATAEQKRKYYASLYESYDRQFVLADFMRTYDPVPVPQLEVPNEKIHTAFEELGKHTYTQQNVDCGACGSESCLDMARKIALGVNIPINCIVHAMETAREEHRQNVIAYEKVIESTNVTKDALERFETVWNNVESGIVIVDAETRAVLDVNPVAERMFGKGKASIIGHRCHKFICPADEHSCPIMDKDQTVDRSERVFLNDKGEAIPVVKSVAKIHYNGRLALLENFTDISHLKEAEEQLRLMKVAEEASAAKSDFLSRMSHEMRTPMNAIIGMTNIGKSAQEVGRKEYCLEQIEIASTHLLGLINDILDMSKIEAGKLELVSEPLNIEKILMKVNNLIIEKIENKGITFHIMIGSGVKREHIGDELRLSQVITNLMSNAVKFTLDGGRIDLTVEKVGAGDDWDMLRFIVADNGIGMMPTQSEKMFQAFEQADAKITRQFGGTGLGLAISKRIVEQMDGRIWVESELGVGSKFMFDVKLQRPAQREDDLAVLGPKRPADLRLLNVDSDRKAREYFGSVVDSFGIHADEAESGAQAVERLASAKEAQKPYDIVFLEYALQDMSGVEAIKKLKEFIDEHTAIVTMTSFINWHNIETDVHNAGVDRFVSKPLFPSSVLDAINEIVGGTGQSSQASSALKRKTRDFSAITLLLAEDVEINREIFITLLEDTNATIDTAENGRIAVEKFAANPDRYDIIIMDVQMPEMDGYEATRVIRALDMERAKTIPIVAMTANAFKEDIDKCLASGMNDHLAKPIDVDDVKGKIAQYTGL